MVHEDTEIMNPVGPVVLKIGGSLIQHAEPAIRAIQSISPDMLIIPGGGVFADTVRRCEVSDTPAHWMAVAAMDQYGWFLSTFGVPVTVTPAFCGAPQILLPYSDLLIRDPLPHTWDITSDTISAYYASCLSAPLIILKSIEYIRSGNEKIKEISGDIVTEDLDPSFIRYVQDNGVHGMIISGNVPLRLYNLLLGHDVPGTRF